jgi:hypothetical protein
MSTPDRDTGPNFFGPPTTPEVISSHIADVIKTALERNSPDLDVDAEHNRNNFLLYLTDRTHNNPVPIRDASGEVVRYVLCDVYVSDQYRDAAGIGHDALGRPAEIMRMDPMAELEERIIDLSITPCGVPLKEWDEDMPFTPQSGWRISYDADIGWFMGFWRNGKDPDVTDDHSDWVEPSEEDEEDLQALLDRADLVAVQAQ